MRKHVQERTQRVRQFDKEICTDQPSQQALRAIHLGNGKMTPKAFWRLLDLPLPKQTQSTRALASLWAIAENPCYGSAQWSPGGGTSFMTSDQQSLWQAIPDPEPEPQQRLHHHREIPHRGEAQAQRLLKVQDHSKPWVQSCVKPSILCPNRSRRWDSFYSGSGGKSTKPKIIPKLYGFGLPWDLTHLSSFLCLHFGMEMFILCLSHNNGIVFWKHVTCLVSQVHSSRAICLRMNHSLSLIYF